MTKSDIIKKIASSCELTQAQVEFVVSGTFDIIANELANGQEVHIQNFGKFFIREKSDRKGRNPQTGEEILIDAHRQPAFKSFKSLKQAVNKSEAQQ